MVFGHSAPVTAARYRLTVTSGSTPCDNSHVKMAEVLHLVLHLTAGVAFALTLLLAEAPRLALLAHLLLAVQLRERRLSSCQPRLTSRSCRRTRCC